MGTSDSDVNVGVVATRAVPGEAGSYVDWSAVVAGAVLASAISLVLLTFGAAIGLSMTSPFENEGASGPVFAVALGLWLLWVIVSSFLAGGYLAGRMRPRVGDATQQEVEIRDGAHGLTVWALGIVVAGLLAAAGISGVVRGASDVAVSVASTASGDTAAADRFGYVVDSLLRSPPGAAANSTESESARQEITRILAKSATQGEMANDDKEYIGRVVAERTGLEPAEAQERVNEVLANVKSTAEAARNAGVVLGFLSAAALLSGAAAAWWGASTGGRHRDEGTDFSRLLRWR